MILFLLIILVTALWIADSYLTKKEILANKLDFYYSKMEHYIMSNRVDLTRDIKLYMRGHKVYVADKRFVDYEIIGGMFYKAQEMNIINEAVKRKERVEVAHPELKDLSKEFNCAIRELFLHKMKVNLRLWPTYIIHRYFVIKNKIHLGSIRFFKSISDPIQVLTSPVVSPGALTGNFDISAT